MKHALHALGSYAVRLVVPVLAAAVVVVALPSEAEACSCGPAPDAKVALENSAATFVGEVVGTRRLAGDGMGKIEYAFEIKHSYKGPTGRTTLVTNASSAACGRSFEEGEAYLVYATADDKGNLLDSTCSRTRLATAAGEDFAAIGQPKGPLESLPDGASIGQAPGPKKSLGASFEPLENFDVISSQCTTLVQGPVSSVDFVQIMTYAGPGAFICTRGVTIDGNVQISEADVRIVALDFGGLSVNGNVIIAAPSVLIGGKVSGATLISERALGSVLVGNSFDGPLITATTEILGVGNQCSASCSGPNGKISLASLVPDSASGVIREVPRAGLAPVPSDGQFLIGGLGPKKDQPRPRFQDRPQLKEVDLGDMTNSWPPPPMENPSSDADVPWLVPVYGPATGNLGVFIPLTPGNFRQPDVGFVIVP